ncbi:hypothetical protein [Heyndrickxia coagulans]|uniref:Uncharacterized protein n=1 Tax=Heyndrickxia coagulans TaxID=1398 RepID=A0AAW7CFF9_HEYCO|nr:hypothetical protein [Heyndrickxia coagulans]MDL5039518.1 hypothetical protein [Heyndrickxia coagulans]
MLRRDHAGHENLAENVPVWAIRQSILSRGGKNSREYEGGKIFAGYQVYIRLLFSRFVAIHYEGGYRPRKEQQIKYI